MLDKKQLGLYQQCKDVFNQEDVERHFKEIADTLAPSQSVKYTRGPVIKKIIQEYKLKNAVMDTDYLETGNGMFYSIQSQPSILFIAHLDQISYLVDTEVRRGVWRLIPYCKHLSQLSVPAVALRFDLTEKRYKKAASGILLSDNDKDKLVPYFKAETGNLESGDRIVYEYPLSVEGDLAKGIIDDAAGVTACLIAGIALFKTFPKSNVGFVFSEEEEGPTENLQYFARGVRRLMRKIPTPDICIIIDGHGGGGGDSLGKGTFYTEKTSGGVATVTPPELFLQLKELAKDIKSLGINMFEDTGRVSRSDDIPCLEVTPNVLSVGYPSINRHFDVGPPAVSISDLVNLAKVIFWMSLKFGKNYG